MFTAPTFCEHSATNHPKSPIIPGGKCRNRGTRLALDSTHKPPSPPHDYPDHQRKAQDRFDCRVPTRAAVTPGCAAQAWTASGKRCDQRTPAWLRSATPTCPSRTGGAPQPPSACRRNGPSSRQNLPAHVTHRHRRIQLTGCVDRQHPGFGMVAGLEAGASAALRRVIAAALAEVVVAFVAALATVVIVRHFAYLGARSGETELPLPSRSNSRLVTVTVRRRSLPVTGITRIPQDWDTPTGLFTGAPKSAFTAHPKSDWGSNAPLTGDGHAVPRAPPLVD